MARKFDTGWRDLSLAKRHEEWGYPFPAAGMAFPMIEYDNRVPVAVVSYIRRGEGLPSGHDVGLAYHAFGSLYRNTGENLPFFTVQYDPRNWAYSVFPHNGPARDFLAAYEGGPWAEFTEEEFASLLYRLRGRNLPDLSGFGVSFATDPWITSEPSPDFRLREEWPHQAMSRRRRCFEPGTQIKRSWRNPCTDVDLAVVDWNGCLSLLVDYKAQNTHVNPGSSNARVLAGVHTDYFRQRSTVPAMMAQDTGGGAFRVYCLNQSARSHLSYVLGCMDGAEAALSHAVVSGDGVVLSEVQWREVLSAARDL